MTCPKRELGLTHNKGGSEPDLANENTWRTLEPPQPTERPTSMEMISGMASITEAIQQHRGINGPRLLGSETRGRWH